MKQALMRLGLTAGIVLVLLPLISATLCPYVLQTASNYSCYGMVSSNDTILILAKNLNSTSTIYIETNVTANTTSYNSSIITPIPPLKNVFILFISKYYNDSVHNLYGSNRTVPINVSFTYTDLTNCSWEKDGIFQDETNNTFRVTNITTCSGQLYLNCPIECDLKLRTSTTNSPSDLPTIILGAIGAGAGIIFVYALKRRSN
jgi:hypothetical protein